MARSPVADERHDRNFPRRSLSPRNCARHDSHPCGRAGAIAGKHSTPASKETPRKRTSRQEHARNYSNARTCSLRCDLVTAPRITQEISTTHLIKCCSRAPVGRVPHRAQRRTYNRIPMSFLRNVEQAQSAQKIDCPSFSSGYSGLPK